MLALRQADYWATVYRRVWRGTVVTSFVLPVLYLAAIGVGLGRYVDDAGSTAALGGLSYLDYVGPGLLATTAMQTAVGESTYPVLAYFVWQKVYDAMIATPLRVRDVLVGHLGYVVLRLATTCTVLLTVLALFGIVHSVAGGLGAVAVAVLVGLAFATPIFAFSARQENDSGYALLYRLGLIPMFLFSGAFFPVSQLPAAIAWLGRLTPVWHGVELCRALTTGRATVPAALGHVGYLLLWVVVGWWLAQRAFRRRLER
jgi:lipooligosaccharide transport system permease protein